MLEKYISIWQWGSGLLFTGGVLAVSGDFVLFGRLPGVKRGHTWQLPHVRTWPERHERNSTGGQRNPAHIICITGVLRRMRAHSPVYQICVIFDRQWMRSSLPFVHFNHCFAPLFVLYSAYTSWGIDTPATMKHSWRGGKGGVHVLKNHLTSNPVKMLSRIQQSSLCCRQLYYTESLHTSM